MNKQETVSYYDVLSFIVETVQGRPYQNISRRHNLNESSTNISLFFKLSNGICTMTIWKNIRSRSRTSSTLPYTYYKIHCIMTASDICITSRLKSIINHEKYKYRE